MRIGSEKSATKSAAACIQANAAAHAAEAKGPCSLPWGPQALRLGALIEMPRGFRLLSTAGSAVAGSTTGRCRAYERHNQLCATTLGPRLKGSCLWCFSGFPEFVTVIYSRLFAGCSFICFVSHFLFLLKIILTPLRKIHTSTPCPSPFEFRDAI